jgi:NAD-dependent dihydropyrimidine dehydrogenase PreA subunit
MIIDDTCVGCGRCHPYCPAEAIGYRGRKSVIDEDRCFECGTCLRSGVCPVEVIRESPFVFDYPRSVRKFFSDPTTTHEQTKIPGRGTEEVKTNDVTGRIKPGEIGIGIEMGRPTVGASLREIEKMTRCLAENGFTDFEKDNPLTNLMLDRKTGKMGGEIVGERVLSAIVEVRIKEEELSRFLRTIRGIADELGTVFSLDLIVCLTDDLLVPVREVIHAEGYEIRENAKVNLGLGRPRSEKRL